MSIVICTYNRPELCRATVEHLLKLQPANTELIIVDQSPLDSRLETTEIPLPSGRRCELIHLSPPGLTRARNVGFRAACGDIVLFVDDDVVPDPTLLTAHLDAYADPMVGGVAGQVRHQGEIQTEGPDARIGDPVTGWLHCQFNHRTPMSVPTARGCNMSFRRELLDRIGGFDELLGPPASFREDTDASFRIRKLGHEIRFIPAAGLLHLYDGKGGTRAGHRDSLGAKLRYEKAYQAHFRDDLYFTGKHFQGTDRRRLQQLALKQRLAVTTRPALRLLVRLHYLMALRSAARLLRRAAQADSRP